MSITMKEVKTFDPPATPEQIIDNIINNGSADHHRANLSALLIAWLRDPHEELDDETKEDVYYTFYTLSEALKEIHALTGKEMPCTN